MQTPYLPQQADQDVAGLQWDKLEKAQQVATAKVSPLRVNLPDARCALYVQPGAANRNGQTYNDRHAGREHKRAELVQPGCCGCGGVRGALARHGACYSKTRLNYIEPGQVRVSLRLDDMI